MDTVIASELGILRLNDTKALSRKSWDDIAEESFVGRSAIINNVLKGKPVTRETVLALIVFLMIHSDEAIQNLQSFFMTIGKLLPFDNKLIELESLSIAYIIYGIISLHCLVRLIKEQMDDIFPRWKRFLFSQNDSPNCSQELLEFILSENSDNSIERLKTALIHNLKKLDETSSFKLK
jgi:hypothetical protein